MSGLTIMYGDIASGAKEALTPSSPDSAWFVDILQLQRNRAIGNYSNPCELNQTILDKSQQYIPTYPQLREMGFWSGRFCNIYGDYATPVLIEFYSPEFSFTAPGLSFTFDPDVGCYPREMVVEWYKDETLLSSVTVTPDRAAQYFVENLVFNFNKVVLRVKSLNMPLCAFKLRAIDYGIGRLFASDDIVSAKLIREISPISESVFINTLDFSLRSSAEFMFQRKQSLEVRYNDELLGVYFVDASNRRGKELWDVSAEDYKGLLDRITVPGDMYADYSAAWLLSTIFTAAGVPYEIHISLIDKTISGHLPKCTAREAVAQICFAISAVVDTSNSDKIRVFPLPAVANKLYKLNEILDHQHIKEESKVTEIQLTEHSYSPAAETVEVYKATASDVGKKIFIEFSEPLWGLSITGGTIAARSANHAEITVASASCVLTGKKHEHVTRVISVRNPDASSADAPNIIEPIKSGLVNSNNAADLAQKVYDYYSKVRTTSSKLLIAGECVGDKIGFETEYMGVQTGRIESMRYTITGGSLVAEVDIRNDY